jgi:hypothetical protein
VVDGVENPKKQIEKITRRRVAWLVYWYRKTELGFEEMITAIIKKRRLAWANCLGLANNKVG